MLILFGNDGDDDISYVLFIDAIHIVIISYYLCISKHTGLLLLLGAVSGLWTAATVP